MKENPNARLGHLAADLLRIANFIESGSANEAKPIIRESKWFAEWIAPEADLETQEMLASIQLFLSCKELQWDSWIDNQHEVKGTASRVRDWSNDCLKRGGFLA